MGNLAILFVCSFELWYLKRGQMLILQRRY